MNEGVKHVEDRANWTNMVLRDNVLTKPQNGLLGLAVDPSALDFGAFYNKATKWM